MRTIINQDNLFQALVILFFLGRGKINSLTLEDDIGDFFSSGSRMDLFIDHCEYIKYYLTNTLLSVGEERFTTVKSYVIWYDNLLSKAAPDRDLYWKWVQDNLFFQDSYPGKEIVVLIKCLFKQNIKTTMQNYFELEIRVSELLTKWMVDNNITVKDGKVLI